MSRWRKALHSRTAAGLSMALLAFAVVLAIRQAGGLQGLELALYDAEMRLRPSPSAAPSPVVIVAIGEDDIQRWGYPLPDAIVHQALTRLDALGPVAIGVDFFRDLPSRGHQALADFARAHPGVIFVERVLGEPVSAPPFIERPEQVGFADLKQDAKGVIRRGLLMLWDEQGNPRFSFSLRLALAALSVRHVTLTADPDNAEQVRLGHTVIRRFHRNDGGYRHADAGGYQFLLDFARGPGGFDRIPFSDLMAGKVPAKAIKGKVALLGLQAASIQDRHETPFSTGWHAPRTSYGVEIHAFQLDQLLGGVDQDRSPIQVLPAWLALLLILLAAMLGAALAVVLEQKTWLLVVAALSVSAAILGLSQLLFIANLCVTSVSIILALWLALGLTAALLAQRERREIGQMMNLFGKFVSPEVAELLWSRRDEFLEHGKPRPQRLTATVMITDLQGFVAATQAMDPDELMKWLNRYLDAMTQIAMQHGGFVDDYAGDGIKINFGVPVPRITQQEIDQDARAAVDCALAMGKQVQAFNRSARDNGMPAFRLRIGINTGTVVVGSLGSDERMKYTTVGDVVNTAARLEALDKQGFLEHRDTPLRILVSAATRQRLGDRFEIESLGPQKIRGKPQPIEVFCVIRRRRLYS